VSSPQSAGAAKHGIEFGMLDVLCMSPYSMGMRLGKSALRQLLIVFLIAAATYALLYTGIERRRNVKGPWQITFSQIADAPAIFIDQPTLGITNVTLIFEGQHAEESPAPHRMHFAEAREVPFDVPYGKVIFLDTTFLPGTVTLQMFGHEIELIPRVLVLDHTAHPWRIGEEIRVTPAKPQPASEKTR
jgi:hypothetical protein